VVNFLHDSAFLGHLQGGIQRRKIHKWPVITHMRNRTFKIQNTKVNKNV